MWYEPGYDWTCCRADGATMFKTHESLEYLADDPKGPLVPEGRFERGSLSLYQHKYSTASNLVWRPDQRESDNYVRHDLSNLRGLAECEGEENKDTLMMRFGHDDVDDDVYYFFAFGSGRTDWFRKTLAELRSGVRSGPNDPLYASMVHRGIYAGGNGWGIKSAEGRVLRSRSAPMSNESDDESGGTSPVTESEMLETFKTIRIMTDHEEHLVL